MSKGARLRAPGGRRDWERRLKGDVAAHRAPIGVGRPTGRARARVRALSATKSDAPVSPWQGFGNAMVVGRSKVARWKNGRIRREVRQLDTYLEGLADSGVIKTLADVVDVRERDDRERFLK